jgi:hypothetical protein
MVEHLLFANEMYDTAKQAVVKNQIIQMNGYEYDRYVVYDIQSTKWGLSYRLINLRTHEFGQCELIRPLSKKYGIGYYYDDSNLQFMDAFEVMILQNGAEQIAGEKRKGQKAEQELGEQLQAIGRERLKTLIPENAKAVIIAELHENESDSMTDYYGYRTQRTVILGFSSHTKDLFSEMRKHASNFEKTTYLATENKEYEHREKYSMGAGYYLGESKYHGWIIEKYPIYTREKTFEDFAYTAGCPDGIHLGNKQADEQPTAEQVNTGNLSFEIVDYSEKAIALFGDTKEIKDLLKAMGGKFNPRLSHKGKKQAGWIFQKSKREELQNIINLSK